jgi:hypothetical protein
VRTRSPARLAEMLADDVVFHSPVVHTPQRGKWVTQMYLAGAIQVLGNASFRYVKQVVQDNVAVLEFESEIDGITINGVDIIRWNTEGLVSEFKVMVRPLKAVNLLHQRMAAMLERKP